MSRFATVAALALPASANTGNVHTAQDCYTWSASVTLNPDVHSDHFVEVTSTIPGTTGIVDGHYNTIGNPGPIQIWHVTGEAPSSGTVTLTILDKYRQLDSTATAKLPPSEVCPTTTTLPPNIVTTTTAPPAVVTTTTLAPTTSVAPTTITLPPTTTTAPPDDDLDLRVACHRDGSREHIDDDRADSAQRQHDHVDRSWRDTPVASVHR